MRTRGAGCRGWHTSYSSSPERAEGPVLARILSPTAGPSPHGNPGRQLCVLGSGAQLPRGSPSHHRARSAEPPGGLGNHADTSSPAEGKPRAPTLQPALTVPARKQGTAAFQQALHPHLAWGSHPQGGKARPAVPTTPSLPNPPSFIPHAAPDTRDKATPAPQAPSSLGRACPLRRALAWGSDVLGAGPTQCGHTARSQPLSPSRVRAANGQHCPLVATGPTAQGPEYSQIHASAARPIPSHAPTRRGANCRDIEGVHLPTQTPPNPLSAACQSSGFLSPCKLPCPTPKKGPRAQQKDRDQDTALTKPGV